MTALKPCPFCGGEVAITETGNYAKFLFITRGNSKNRCNCRIFMESKPFFSDSSESEKQKAREDLIEAWNKRYKED